MKKIQRNLIGILLICLMLAGLLTALPLDASAETVTQTSEKIYGYAGWGGVKAATFELEVEASVRITFAYSEGLSSISLVKIGSGTVTPTSVSSGSGNYGDTYKYDKMYYYDLEPGEYAINVFAGGYENTGGTVYWLQIRATYEAHTHDYSYSTKKVAPTCTARGYMKHTCSCGDYYTDNYVDKLPHTEVYAPREAPTCTKTGKDEGTKCSVCGTTISGRTEIPKLPHDTLVEIPRIEPTCTTLGKTTGAKCSVCGTISIAQESIPKLPHDTLVEIPRVEPTCTTLGKTTGAKCSVCGAVSVSQENIPMLPHTEVSAPDVAATCTATGKADVKVCEVCGTELSYTIVPLLPHEYEDNFCIHCNAADSSVVSAYGQCGNNAKWVLTKSGTLTISGTGAMKNYSFNNTPWYDYRSSVKSIVVEDGITSIGSYAFYECRNATSVSIPETVTILGDYCLEWCSSLTKITLHAGVTSIGTSAFYGCGGYGDFLITYSGTMKEWVQACKSCYEAQCSDGIVSEYGKCGENAWYMLDTKGVLTVFGTGTMNAYSSDSYAPWFGYRALVKTIVVEDGITDIGNYAFYDCLYATSVSISDTVTSLGKYSFSSCDTLASIEIPSSVTSIGEAAFEGCNKLTSISIPNAVTTIEKNTFHSCTSLKKVTIPSSVTTIKQWAFSGCSNLSNVMVPISVTTIEKDAFEACKNIGITYPGTMREWARVCASSYTTQCSDGVLYYYGNCGKNAWWMLDNKGVLTLFGTGAMNTYSSNSHAPWYAYRTSVKSIIVENGITGIGPYAFNYCSNATSVSIPETVTSLGNACFSNCSSLTAIKIPASVTSVGTNAFAYCSKLSITYAGKMREWAKSNSSLYQAKCTDGTISKYGTCGSNARFTLDSHGKLCVYGTGPMYDYSVKNGVPNTPWYEFWSSIKSVVIEDGITTVGEDAFYDCTQITSVSIASSVTDIRYYAFYRCSSLTSVHIPTGLKSIYGSAFSNCSSLTAISIPTSVTYIGNYTFRECSSLIKVTIPTGVTQIEPGTFKDCTALQEATIPSGVTVVNAFSFSGCSNLTAISIPSSVTSIGKEAFISCSSLKRITFEGAAPQFGTNAFKNVKATAYYRSTDPTWTAAVRQNYGGTITWKAIEKCSHKTVKDAAVKPTCTGSGKTEGSHCSTCGAVLVPQQLVAPLGHTEAIDHAVAPGCTAEGLSEGKHCAVCSLVLVKQEIVPATGHSYGYAVEQEPTLTETGALKGTCTGCNGETTVELPMLDDVAYDYAVTAEPTYTETGLATYTWKDTAYGTYTFEVVLEVLPILYGDVNGDGTVNNKDRLVLTRYLAKWTDYPAEIINMAAADVNGDGKVNNLDRLILTRHLAKWTGYETLPYKQ